MSRARISRGTLPRTAFFLFQLGVFFLFVTIGLSNDILQMGRLPKFPFALSLLVSGVFPVCYAIAGFTLRGRIWKAFLPIFALHMTLLYLLGRKVPREIEIAQMSVREISRMQGRLSFDGIAIIFAVLVGYGCFLYVTITQGRRYFRMQAEIELATEIHHVLVPAIETKMDGYEFYGRSSPSGEVGGDLIDVAGTDENWVAYLADVSGHGVAPGVVMGMVKSAARMLLSSGDDAGHLLPRLNEVLYPLKKPDMFVTFCFVARSGDALRIGLAGHPAILRFSAGTGVVTELECPNMPLGILPVGEFASSEIRAEPGDVFALYTDGFVETANRAGVEFGGARFAAEFQKRGGEPLEIIYRSLQESVARYGAQFDDQSLLLIRKS
jgi:hypothetical protein